MRHALGIDVGGTSMRVGLVREDGSVLASASRPTGFDTPRAEVLERFAAAIREALGAAPACRIEGVGIGMPGLQDEAGRVASASNLPELNGVDLRAEASRVAGVPAAMENDLNVVALGEYYFGGHAVGGNLLVVAVGTGVGAAVVQGGRLLRVFRGSLGDPGHILVEPGGPRCRCGARGCLEAHCAGWALLEQARAAGMVTGPGITGPRSEVRGPRSQDHGPQTPDHGPQTTDHGPQTTDHGPQTTDHGPQTTHHGPQTTHHGPQTTHHGPQTTDHGPQTTDHGPQTTELRPADIFDAARSGHPQALELIERAAGWLGMGLASFCALYQPERIVLGGNVLVEGADLLLPSAQRRMREMVQPWMRDIRVELSRIPQTAGVLGGAAMVLGVRGEGLGVRGEG